MPIDQAAVEREIIGGMPNERPRLDRALQNLDFYHGRFERYPIKPPGAAYENYRYQRHSLLMRRVVDVLTANLYKDGPARQMPDHPAAAEWLNEAYKCRHVDAVLHAADTLATIADCCAVQVHASDDPDCPVEFVPWDAFGFAVWTEPEDRIRPAAVATIDVYDEQRRLRLWTAEQVVEFRTRKLLPLFTAGGTAYEEVPGSRQPNPYGIIPFAFVHFSMPMVHFWSDGPGSTLREANDYLNHFLTEHGDSIRFNSRPVITARGVRTGWRPPSPIQPGDVWDIPDEGMDAAGSGLPSEVAYLQADTGYISSGWEDCRAFIDHTLEMSGVPPAAVRLVQAQARSGVSIVAEQLPLILWAIGRQRAFGCYEAELARVAMTVAARHPDPRAAVPRAELEAAAADRDALVLRWATMWPRIPGEETDIGDRFELDEGLTSRVEVLMRRRGLTREEAEDALRQIAEDRKRERELLGPTEPAPLGEPGKPPEEGPKDDDEGEREQAAGE